MTNLILNTDSYKFSHYACYPAGIKGMYSYIESRSKNELIVPFGLQYWIKKNLLTPITAQDIIDADVFAKAHGIPFNKKDWWKVLYEYDGFLPLTIKTMSEGQIIDSSTPFISVECTDPDLFWLTSYIETSLLRTIWYGTTIASNGLKYRQLFKEYYKLYSDVSYAYNFVDFGSRGVSSEDTAEVGGAAHTIFFKSSDNILGINAANKYYKCDMAAFSIPAMEHSVQCAFGPEGQYNYILRVLSEYKGKTVSIVLDGYDVLREVQMVCEQFKRQIITTNTTVVFRLDSGDPLPLIFETLKLQEQHFGYTTNSKGLKVLNHVKILQGDGVDLQQIASILYAVTGKGFAPENIVFGSGGALLQKVNRDTYKFAMKASAILNSNDQWIDIYKDPITDPGKRSKSGRFENINTLVYKDGKLYNETTLDRIRLLANAADTQMIL